MVVESIDVLRLYSFKGDALSWSVRIVGTSGPPQRSYSQRNTVGVEACRRRGGGRGRWNRAFVGTITTTTTNTWLTSGLQFHHVSDFWGYEFHHRTTEWSYVKKQICSNISNRCLSPFLKCSTGATFNLYYLFTLCSMLESLNNLFEYRLKIQHLA